jgi:superfamily II DNA or RNA helicase
MNSESLPELLRLLRDLEVFRVAIALFPTRLNEIQMSPDLRAWVVRETTFASVVGKLPAKVLDRIEAGGFDVAAHLAAASVAEAVSTAEDSSAAPTDAADLKWTPTPVLPPWKLMLTDPVASLFGEVLRSFPSVLRKRGMAHVDRFEALDWSERLGAWWAEILDEARFEVWANPVGRHSCTCMEHADHDMCEHVAAFLTRLVREASPPAPEMAVASDLPVVGESRLGKLEFVPEPATGDLARILERMGVLANTLEPMRVDGDNPRVRVVYVLVRKPARIVQKAVECGERMDLVPQTQTLGKESGWKLDDVDLRKVLGGRLESNPPKYVSEIDVHLIGCCDTLPSGVWDTGVNAFLWQSTLRKAALTGRLIDETERPLSMDERLWKWEPQLVEREGIAEFQCRVRSLDADAETVELSGDVVVFGREQDALVKWGSRLLCLDPRTPAALLDPVVPRFKVPVAQMPRLRRELRLFALAGAAVPPSYLPRRLRELPQRRLRVEVRGDSVVLTPVPWYPSLGEVSEGAGGVVAFTTHEGELVELERDRPAESELCRKLSADLEGLGMSVAFDGGASVVQDPESLRRLALGALDKLWNLGWTPVTDAASLDRWKKRKGVFRASLKASGLDWFELGGVVDFDGFEVPLSQLVGRSGSIVLDDGSMAEIPQKLLRRLEWMKTLGAGTDDGIRLKAEHATLAQDLMRNELAEMVDVAHWTEVLDRLQFAEEPPTEPPASLLATLRPYQLDGLAWMQSLRDRKLGGILADDMGLGKTVQVIGHLCRLYEREPDAPPVLVVAPASVVGNWVSELARFAPHMETRLLHGADRGDLIEAPITGPTIFVTTYGILPRETEWTDATEFSVLVLDESQTVRNPATVAHKTVAMIRARQKLCLTGTPIENSLADLWAQFAVLNPGLLGPLDEFMEQFDAPPGEIPDLSRLRTLTAPFWLRRTKDKVASELPARQDIELGIDLDPKQMSLYNRQLQEFQRNLLPVVKEQGLENGARFEVLTALLRLRQIACAPELAGHQGPASKLDVLLEKLTEDVAEGHKAIVFSSFTSLLDLVGKRLSKESIPFLRIDGSTPAKERTRLVERFQKKDREDVILVSLKAGGAGINLTAADYVFLLDPWWNPAAEEQAAARAHRIGQTRPVTVYRMVARGTIEERVLELSRSKAALARDVFDAGESGGAALTAEVVAQLLG